MSDAKTVKRWALILAGGSGKRLQSLTRDLFGEGPCGGGRPKQFCALFGRNTLLTQTRARIAAVVPAEKITFVVVKAHAPYYKEELRHVEPHRIFAQPADRGTTPAIAYSLARIAAVDPEAVVGIFPADHYFADQNSFTASVRHLYQLAGSSRDTVFLLGAQPEQAEVDYGWIEPGRTLVCTDNQTLFRVKRFWEKPSAEVARGWHKCLNTGRFHTIYWVFRGLST